MLFDPCGELKKDYSAFCQVLRRTEREEIFGGILTSEERRAVLQQEVVKSQKMREETLRRQQELRRTSLSEKRNSVHFSLQNIIQVGNTTTTTVAGDDNTNNDNSGSPNTTPTTEGVVQRLSLNSSPSPVTAPLSKQMSPLEDPAMTANAAEDKAAKDEDKPSAVKTKRSVSGNAKTKRTSTLKGQVVEEPVEDPNEPRPPPSLTFISLRHPTFCINARDITPLTRAMQHCKSLVSISFVGAGLSVESYMLLVEAVYKNRSVASVAVDFNAIAAPGFYEDPTVGHLSPLRREGTTEAEELVASGEEKAEGDHAARAASVVDETKHDAVVPAKKEKPATVKGAKPVEVPDIPPLPPDEPGVIYLKPSEYCGLNTLPTPLEIQINEEKEKKGKVDPKKLQQLQQQKEALEQFDVQNRIRVPRGWEGILYTAIRHLSLRGNGIDDTMLRGIAHLLKDTHSRLLSLNLWGNLVGDDGARQLADMLRLNRTLRALDVGHNLIGDEGLLELTDVLRTQDVTGLEEVSIHRSRYLGRLNSSPEERAAAATATPSSFPAYKDLYHGWWLERAEQEGGAPTTTGKGKDGGSGNKRSSSKGGKGKGEAAAAVRSTVPFDRDCIRLEESECGEAPATSGGNTNNNNNNNNSNKIRVRIPGNGVLEMLNIAENAHVTVLGVREVLRRLQLHEPSPEQLLATAVHHPASEEQQQQLQATPVHQGSSILPPPAQELTFHSPERYCTALRLRSLHVSNRRMTESPESLQEMAQLQEQIQATLDTWAPVAATTTAAATAVEESHAALSPKGKQEESTGAAAATGKKK